MPPGLNALQKTVPCIEGSVELRAEIRDPVFSRDFGAEKSEGWLSDTVRAWTDGARGIETRSPYQLADSRTLTTPGIAEEERF